VLPEASGDEYAGTASGFSTTPAVVPTRLKLLNGDDHSAVVNARCQPVGVL